MTATLSMALRAAGWGLHPDPHDPLPTTPAETAVALARLTRRLTDATHLGPQTITPQEAHVYLHALRSLDRAAARHLGLT